MYKAILFDLDGTLLPLDQEKFVELYFSLLTKKMMAHGYEPELFVKTLWSGVKKMVLNDTGRSNEEVFLKYFFSVFVDKSPTDAWFFREFYLGDFNKASVTASPTEESNQLIKKLKAMGYRLVLASNPVFPQEATSNRVRWAGLDWDDFEFVTTYENSHSGKPNPTYYLEILDKLGLEAKDCLMVGNDVTEDIYASGKVGIDSFLVDHCNLNNDNLDISKVKKGSFADLLAMLEK